MQRRSLPTVLQFYEKKRSFWKKRTQNAEYMKVAIASNGNTLDSNIDSSFARCSWFIIYDTENGAMEFIPNTNKDIEEHAGKAAVDLVLSRNVSMIVSGDFGMKIKPLLDSMHIQMVVIKDSTKGVNQIIELLNNRRN